MSDAELKRQFQGETDSAVEADADPGAQQVQSKPAPGEEKFKYVHSANLPDLLEHLNITVVATTFQAGRVLAFSGVGGRCSLLLRAFLHPMGVAVDHHRMALVCSNQVWGLTNQTDLVDRSGNRPNYDAYFIPRIGHVTGDIAGHEAAWGRPAAHEAPAPDGQLASQARPGSASDLYHRLWVVNTRFSCLCTLDQDYSFIPQWQPPFITQLAPEDRCHLNGMAMVDGLPRYVTMLGQTNQAQGWRDAKATGGCVMDMNSGEVMVRELAMPHSPRVYRNRLWFLESGRAELQYIDLDKGTKRTVIRLPGYVRGLAFYDRFAFVGLSKARESRTFGGLPIDNLVPTLLCGIQVVDIDSGKIVAFIQFEGGVEELFDVQVLPNVRKANVIGFNKETINGIFVLPRRQ